MIHDNGITEVLYGGAASGGKSFLGSAWLIMCCLRYPGTRWVMGRAVLKTIKETTLNTFFDVCRQWGLKEGVHWDYNTKDNIIRFNKNFGGSEILLKDLYQYPSDPEFDALGSLEITGAFVDEVSQITARAKQILSVRVRYRLREFCTFCGGGNGDRIKKKEIDGEDTFRCNVCGKENTGLLPKTLYATNPSKNWAYTEFYKPFREGRLDPTRMFITALPSDNRHISHTYIKQLEALPDGARQRLLHGNWEYDDDIASLIPYPKILELFTPRDVSGGDRYITADIARQGRDKTVVGVWDGLMLIRVETMDKNKINEAVDLINQLRREHKVHSENVAIDADGIGAGVTDYIEGSIGIVNNSMPIRVEGQKENFGNLKSQLYFYLAEYINKGRIFVRANPELRELITSELELVRRKDVDRDGKFWVLPKQEVKDLLGRSPDFSDMMAYRMIFELTNQGRYL